MNPLSCLSDLLGGRAGDSRTLENVPDGKNSDAKNIYGRLLGAKGSLGLFDKQLEGHLAHSRPYLNLLETLGTKLSSWPPSFRKENKGTWGQSACPRSFCHSFIQKWVSLLFENPNMTFWWLRKNKNLLYVLVLDIQDNSLAAFISSPWLEKWSSPWEVSDWQSLSSLVYWIWQLFQFIEKTSSNKSWIGLIAIAY